MSQDENIASEATVNLYALNAAGFWTGEIATVPATSGFGAPWIYAPAAPPAAGPGQGVRWGSGAWEVVEDNTAAVLLAGALAAQLQAAEAHYNRVAQEPVAWDFGQIEGKDDHGVSTGPAGLQTLQMRVDPATAKDDPKNWLAALSGAQLAIMLGAPNTLTPLKTTANIWVQATALQAAQALALGDGPSKPSMLQIGRQRLARFGQIKAQLVAAAEAEGATAADVLAIDVTSGYGD